MLEIIPGQSHSLNQFCPYKETPLSRLPQHVGFCEEILQKDCKFGYSRDRRDQMVDEVCVRIFCEAREFTLRFTVYCSDKVDALEANASF